ncbi:MAG TPA: hypothetical protein VEY07_04060 [Thermoplasmata archaeon]|nr:hypothetical protein [Thermoplasmata archaeon]
MIDSRLRVDGREVWLAGVVRGFAPDVPLLIGRLDEFAPKGVGVGISFDELTGLTDHFVNRPSEPLVPLATTETAELLGLARFGEVRVPNPAYVRALEWSHARSIPVEALEVSDEQYSQLFADHISYVELVGRTLRERRLTRTAPEAKSADEYAIVWERELARGRGSKRFLDARVAAIVAAARRLVERVGRAAVVVDRERYDAVMAGLRGPN